MTYTSAHRGGKTHIKLLAQLNNKSFCGIQQGRELHATIVRNNTVQWYWQDFDSIVRTDSKEIDLDGKETDLDYTKECYRADGSMWLDYPRPAIPNNLYQVFDKFFECDHILHPEALLGYHGYTKPDREGLSMNDALEQDIKYLNVDLDYSISELKKRKNFIVYKEDIRHWARSWFLGGGQVGDDYEVYYNMIACRLNSARKYTTSIQIALDRYNIPYETWSLDSGDYHAFGFTKLFDRYVTEGSETILKEHLHYMVDDWIDRYMSENP